MSPFHFRFMPGSLALAATLFGFAACDKTADPAPTSKLLTVSSPKDGSVWKVGDSLVVTWARNDDPSGAGRQVSAIEVFLSPDGGQNWGSLTKSRAIQPPSTQWDKKMFKWMITDSVYITDLNKNLPVSGTPGSCRLRIQDYTLNTDPDLGDTTGAFTINP